MIVGVLGATGVHHEADEGSVAYIFQRIGDLSRPEPAGIVVADLVSLIG